VLTVNYRQVLGAMTQAAMLHVQGTLVNHGRISRALQVLQSSSPSYLLMASLDSARLQVHEQQGGPSPLQVLKDTVGTQLDSLQQGTFRDYLHSVHGTLKDREDSSEEGQDSSKGEGFLDRGIRLASMARREIAGIPALQVLGEEVGGTFVALHYGCVPLCITAHFTLHHSHTPCMLYLCHIPPRSCSACVTLSSYFILNFPPLALHSCHTPTLIFLHLRYTHVTLPP
jgi:hypothetical protein